MTDSRSSALTASMLSAETPERHTQTKQNDFMSHSNKINKESEMGWGGRGRASQLNRARSVLPADVIRRDCVRSACILALRGHCRTSIASNLVFCTETSPDYHDMKIFMHLIEFHVEMQFSFFYYFTDLQLLSFLSGCPNFSVSQSEFDKKKKKTINEEFCLWDLDKTSNIQTCFHPNWGFFFLVSTGEEAVHGTFRDLIR